MSSGKRSRAAQEDPNVQDQNSWVLRTPDKQIPPRSTSVPVDKQKNHMRKDSWPELLRIYSEILNHNEEDQISDPTSLLLLDGGIPAETNENADLYVQNLSHGGAGSSNSSSVREVVGPTTTDMVASSVSHSRINTNSCSQTTSNRMEPKSDHLKLATQCSPSYSNQRLPVSNRYTQEGSNRVSSESTALMLQKQNFPYSSNRMPNSLCSQVGNNRNEPDINNLQLLKHDYLSSFNQTHTKSSSFQSTVDGYPVSYWPDHNINSPPRPVSNAEFCASASFHFAPLTPDKGKHLERQPPSERSGVLLDECSGQEMDKQRNVVTSTSGRTNNRPSEFSQIIADSTTTGLLTPLMEDNLDEIGEQGLDSHKTPDPKTTKKRKHRPKVVKEGTPKSAQKHATPKTKVSDISSTGERKYVCKKHIKSPESQQDLVGNEGKVPAAKSSVKACRRALNFDLASAARDASQEITDSHQAAKGPVNNEIPQHNDMAHQIDELICQLKGLSINSRRDIDEPELHALVPYEGFDKKHKPQRPKVQIDPETHRIWNLLMRREEGETAEETDKEKWWEEREVFRGRAESFIYRMRLVQGNRRFSRWKGSVVDSVVGVFLTQNVSDHLSSSAFMSLAAIFPLQSAVEPVSFSGETRLNIEPGLGPKDYHDFGFTEKSLPPFRNTPTHLRITKIEGASLVKGLSGSMAEGKSPSQKNGMPTVEAPVLNQTTFSRNYPTHNGSVQPEHCAYSTNNNELDNSKNSDLERTAVKEPARPHKGETVRIHGQHRQKLLDNRTEANANEQNNSSVTSLNETTTKFSHAKKGKAMKNKFDWDKLRKQAQSNGKRERSKETMDSLDYEAMRCSDVNKIANAIKERGLNNKLAERIKDFLNRLVDDHGSIDLEWLRDAPPDKAKDYLRSFQGLGLKSVECIRLLTLHQIAFPVDTNVGRIAVRLGWVPLQPLPESIQLHLLEQYPVLESVQKYLWPRLCKLDQETLYELHYQMITFGKVFCTKNKPNCNACPLRGECRHFASAFASARLALPAPEEKSIVDSAVPFKADGDTVAVIKPVPLLEAVQDKNKDAGVNTRKNEPIVEEPSTPEQKKTELEEGDIEDALYENPDEIPTIKLNIEEFATNLQKYMQDNMELQDDVVSRALVALNPQAASIPAPKLKNVSRLRTEHQVYELPDSHPLLEKMDKREPDDPSAYLLAIWTPGETAYSVQPPEQRCESHESGQLCSDNTCFTCNSTRETNAQIVRGTVLIPCRTATRGSFPLNGTYFQVNEMFADHESSLNPIDVPRSLIWNLPRRTVYFGTSVTSIFRGLSMEAIQFCFWRGFVCVRGFDRKQRVPRPLMARLHFTANRLAKNQE